MADDGDFFPDDYFPGDYWPDDYFPADEEAAVVPPFMRGVAGLLSNVAGVRTGVNRKKGASGIGGPLGIAGRNKS